MVEKNISKDLTYLFIIRLSQKQCNITNSKKQQNINIKNNMQTLKNIILYIIE